MTNETIGGVVKVVELVGSSSSSFSDAVRNAVRVASKTIRNIRGVDVLSSSADVDNDGNLVNYKVNCKIAFLVESGPVHDGTEGTEAQTPHGPPPPAGGGTSPTGPA
jgi:flavin-binding protein dodecin